MLSVIRTLGHKLHASKTIPFKHRWLATAALVSAALVVISMIIFNATTKAHHEIDALALANADQRLWSIIEVEEHVIELQRDLWRANTFSDADIERIRSSFDSLTRSVSQIRASEEYQELFENPTIQSSFTGVERGIAQITPLFAAQNADLWVQIPVLLQASEGMLSSASALSNAALPAFATLAMQHRESVANSLFELGFIIVLMFWILFVSVVVLLFSLRSGAMRTSEIAATRNRLNAIIGTSLDGVLVLDRDGKILDYNGAASRIFGYAQNEAIGQDLADLIIPNHLRAAHREGMKNYLNGKRGSVVDGGLIQLEAIDKNGRVFPVELSISAAESETGEIFVSFIRDISERVVAEAELVDARDKAVSGEKAKANMLAVMSHEIRTPLNGLLGSLQLLTRTKLNTRQQDYVEVMKTSGQMLLEHVNNVLDISRVDAGKTEKLDQKFNLAETVNGIASSLQSQADARGNSISVSFLGAPVSGAIGDKARLTQILVNLVGNAIKFTESGSVTIEVERDSTSDEVEFRVIDTGIGISDANAKNIFEDFVTLDTSFRREVEGTGLGLGIVKRLVTLLSGQIGVESVVGEGSVFWVRIPFPAAELSEENRGESTTHVENSPLPPRSVLLVEDNEINRLVAREMLASFGCSTTEAVDGLEGVTLASKEKFDVILCDISMPRMDGIDATRQIRAGDGPNKHTPVIALTAHALPNDIQRFREAGMNDVVIKPLTFDEIRRVAANLTLESGAQAHSDPISFPAHERLSELSARARSELTFGLTKLHNLIAEGSGPESIKDTAHRLAGVAAVSGFSRLHAQLNEIEHAVPESSTHLLESMTLNAKGLIEPA